MNISLLEAKSRLHYDPITGVFTRTKSLSNAHKAGDEAGSIRPGKGYVYIKLGTVAVAAHRLAYLFMTGEWPEHEIDHINGIRHDNRWSNLRPATRGENMRNKSLYANNSSGCQGVTFHSRIKQWQVRVQCDGRRIHVGYFNNFEDAVKAREMAESAHHGAFAASLSRERDGSIKRPTAV